MMRLPYHSAEHRADHVAAVAQRIDPAADVGRVGAERGVVAEVEQREATRLRAGVDGCSELEVQRRAQVVDQRRQAA